MQEGRMKLSDGRTLAYAIYGPDEGRPVLYFHGTPSSRLELLLHEVHGTDLNALLVEAGMKIIAFDRSGMGFSSFNKNRTYQSVASDAKSLLEALKIPKSSLLCWSGGGPFALAFAYHHPELTESVSIICGFTKKFDKDIISQMGMNKWYFVFAKNTPWLVRMLMNILKRIKIRSIPPQWITGLPHVDYKFINPVHYFSELARISMKEAARNGARGPVTEARNYYREFGFDISSINCSVHYWWGTEDMSVIRLHAEEVERKIKHATMHYREGEGHISLYLKHFREVLQVIARIS